MLAEIQRGGVGENQQGPAMGNDRLRQMKAVQGEEVIEDLVAAATTLEELCIGTGNTKSFLRKQ